MEKKKNSYTIQINKRIKVEKLREHVRAENFYPAS